MAKEKIYAEEMAFIMQCRADGADYVSIARVLGRNPTALRISVKAAEEHGFDVCPPAPVPTYRKPDLLLDPPQISGTPEAVSALFGALA